MMNDKTISVLIYEDNKPLRNGLAQLIGGTPGFELRGAFADCSKLLEQLKREEPDVILMDINMPGMNGIEAASLIKKIYPEIKVIMQTIFQNDDLIFQSICAGASGYLLKNTPSAKIIEAIQEVTAGGAPMSPVIASKALSLLQRSVPSKSDEVILLTEKEKEFLTLLTEGLSYKMIASEMNISIDGVRAHVRKIYLKLHVHSMSEAVSKALKQRLI